MKSVAALIALPLTATAAFAGGMATPTVQPEPTVVATPAPVATVADWSGFYAGLQYGQGNAETDGAVADLDADFDAYGAFAGYQRDFGRFVLGGELDYNTVDVDGLDEDADLTRLRAKMGYDAGRFLPYLTVGAAQVSLDNTAIGDISETGVTYGIGADYLVTDRFSVGAEYTRNQFDEVENTDIDLDTDMVQVRAAYRF
ncbi:outer membrane protein [Pseudoroseicyclus aestuarii]|uniref:Opacity protein-like surface antigen n=1 Tax=Pseudoroseicyclus aestuarii TaxID=1795041 RepID=A0A318SUW2_9RHOB|nr:porin family protein [Pseudoroseicyclus aestuarii]PYE83657.1 opacity protein-like surface antigen [Pseudoroseicyclus aestuarii]